MLLVLLSLALVPSWGATTAASVKQQEDLTAVQSEIKKLEGSLSDARLTEASLHSDLQRLEKLLRLQALEIQLSVIEMEKMEDRLKEMELRYLSLSETIIERKKRLRNFLSVLPSLEHKSPLVQLTERRQAAHEQYREFVSRLVTKDREEILSLRQHLDEVDKLRAELNEERERVIAHTDDLKEKQAILALNQNLKRGLLKKTRAERSNKLRVYEAAKAAETELESMLSRIHKDKVTNVVSAPVKPGTGFIAHKGRLPFPAEGEIISAFGKKYDPSSSLYTFHKGIDIRTRASSPVRAVAAGTVVFNGQIGGYGKLLILDHGEQFYSLVGQLGDSFKKSGDSVREGDIIATSAADNSPLYFEIRQRHVAVNPVPWLRSL